jgi:hypothetical protein
MTTRIIRRTPDLGLTLKMQPGCRPEIGQAAWWNHRSRAYDLQQLVAIKSYNYALSIDGVDTTLAAAQVTGDLCGCAVNWSTTWATADPSASLSAPDILTPDRALAVGLAVYPREQGIGLLTATATVICDGQRKVLAPIYLVIVYRYSG